MKDQLIIYLALIALCLAFAIVSLIVFLTNGKSSGMVARKLKLGALILTLTASLSSGCRGPVENDRDPWGGGTCYLIALDDDMIIKNYEYSENGFEVCLTTSNVLECIIYQRIGQKYSFALTNEADNTIFQEGNIYPSDGTFDESKEEFKIYLSMGLKDGIYYIEFYNRNIEDLDGVGPQTRYKLNIYSRGIIE